MADKYKLSEPFTIGLDIGIASVGWAVLGENRIIDLGVRCFDKAETAKEGESLNFARRSARLMRRRLRRRAWRLTKLARLLKREGLIADVGVLKQQPSKGFSTPNLWRLRVEGLDRKLNNEEWARIIYHICKHRGFHWTIKAEAKAADSDKEGGKVKQGLSGTKRLMLEKSYRSAAEMVLAEFPDAQRNKQGEYSKALSRELLADELKLLFSKQRELGNAHVSEALEAQILGNEDKKSGLFWAQKPALSGEALLKMLGKCTFERDEFRAPKASFTAERHVLLTRINNLRIVEDGKSRGLTPDERRIALHQPYQQAGDFKYRQLGSALVNAGYLVKGEYKFAGLSYPRENDEKAKNPEDAVLAKLPAWQELKKTLTSARLESEWKQVSEAALNGKPELLDQIAWVISVYKEDDEVARKLAELDLPNKEKMIEALQLVRFDKFSNLSLKALRKIVPHMENGMRYDEACEEAGYRHSMPDVQDWDAKAKYLPPLYSGRDKQGRMVFNEEMDIPCNPVVLRALNQSRKVVNALIRKYGAPHAVHIEMARDLSRPMDERRKIERAQADYRTKNEDGRKAFAKEFGFEPKGRQFEKYMLYREQQGKCAYSLEALELDRVLNDQGYAEVDHALPYSRSFDDSKNNRVLVLTSENRNKGNQTPFEYMDGKSDSEQWRRFEVFVNGNKAYRQAKRNRLLKKDFGESEARDFRERNLNDTRYICRFFKNYVEQYLQLHEDSDAKRCVVVSGQLTSLLRFRWGINKVRSESDRHHALDAAVVAACSHGFVKRMSDYARRKELKNVRDRIEKVDAKTGEILDHFPMPWDHFRQELLARLNIDDPDELRAVASNLGTYPQVELDLIRPLFVSRAPQRRNSGPAHKETIYGQPESLKEKGSVTQKVAVSSLKPTDVDKLIDPDRNRKLYAYLRKWLEGKDVREKKAKEIEKSAKSEKRGLSAGEKAEIEKLRALPRKPDKEGNPTGPIVRSVTMRIDKLSGIPVRGGIAKNDTMLRVDVFEKENKFYLIPVYVYHLAKKALPDRAAKANTPREEWTLIDDSYAFCFSLYPNDLIRLKNKKEDYFGYFVGMGITTASLSIKSHDNNQAVATGKAWQGTWVNLGVKTGIECFQKFNVDALGNAYPALPEVRRELA